MLDMIYRYKVSIVVILMRPEESRIKISKWIPYFPLSDDIFKTSNYIVTRTKYMDVDKNMISESEYSIHNGKDELFNFTILHYQGWPDKNIPCEHRSIYELYTKIMNIDTDNYIAIHCSGGIGRSGTLGLIIYLIDTINLFPSFDPIARLGYLRKHRYKAVQTYSQFVFALLVVFDHFKKKIDDMDPNAYQKFYNMARRIFVKDGCLKT
uniref:Protein-tyrosine phosphatase n=1 Tax=Strongyloides venezuelensis TaxID=75913 RepID=A0A0K0FAL1_STRVS